MPHNYFDPIATEYENTISIINSLDDWVYLKNLPKNRDRVLDIGCGTGRLLVRLSDFFSKCYGIDISNNMINIASKNLPTANFICADANILPYEDNYFDLIVCHTSLQFLDSEKILPEIKRVLKPDGTFINVGVAQLRSKMWKKIVKPFWRIFWEFPRLVYTYGFIKALKAFVYLDGPKWRKSLNLVKENIFPYRDEFKDLYEKYFPGGTFGVPRHSLMYFIWKKQ